MRLSITCRYGKEARKSRGGLSKRGAGYKRGSLGIVHQKCEHGMNPIGNHGKKKERGFTFHKICIKITKQNPIAKKTHSLETKRPKDGRIKGGCGFCRALG